MKIIKLAVIGCVLWFAFKHRAEIHLPAPFTSHTAGRVQELEREIGFRKEAIADINQRIAKMPAAGTVVGRTGCGANIRVTQSAQPQMQIEMNRIQGEIDNLERKLQEARQIPSNSSETQR